MAAVTVVARSYKANAAGALTEKIWKVTGADTNTLDTGIKSPARSVEVFCEPSTITAIAQSTVNGQIRLTFSASGPFTATGLLVKYRNG